MGPPLWAHPPLAPSLGLHPFLGIRTSLEKFGFGILMLVGQSPSVQNGSWLRISQEAAPFYKERGSYSCPQTEALSLTSSSLPTGFQLGEGASLVTVWFYY